MKKLILTIWSVTAVFSAAAHAAVSGPYTPDADTLHLWHFDSVDGEGNVPDEVSINPLDLWLYLATVTDASAPDFGTALNTYNGTVDDYSPVALPESSLNSGQPITDFMNPAGGAFTFEAIVKPLMAPGTLPNPMEIICADTAETGHARAWQFRIEQTGTTLRFQQIAGSIIAFDAAITYQTGQWYHAAVTFNGNLGQADNLKLYWTPLDSAAAEAQLVGTGTMTTSMLIASPVDFSIGNELRFAGGSGITENFEGLIDEVRISSIARASDDMLITSGASSPVILSDPNDTAAHETQPAAFAAVFTSQSAPTVTWFKAALPDDLAMDPADVQTLYDWQTQQYTSTLTISGVTFADAGQYYCQIVNDSGYPQTTAAANLLVYGLVAHWTLDQDKFTGGYYLEEIGGYDAAVSGTPTFVQGANGISGHATQISASDGWAMCPVMDPVRQSGQMTVSFWANWTQTPGTQQDLLAESSNGEMLTDTNGLKADGLWQHVCTVFDGTAGKLYVDGVLQDQGPWLLPAETEAAVNIGIGLNEQHPFTGSMDDMRIFNYALTGTEVADLRYALSGQRSCILAYGDQYDLSGPQGQADCTVDLYDLAAFAAQWLSVYDMQEFADLAASWQTDGLYPAE